MKFLTATVAALAVVLCATAPRAQEHPSEHPSQGEPDHGMSIDQLAEAITHYVKTDAKLKGGYFLVYDAEKKKTLELTLDKVHKDKLATLGNGVYFACADFTAQNGKTYDIDIFMKGDPGNLEPTDVSIHKVDGKARYTWKEEGGVWKKVEA